MGNEIRGRIVSINGPVIRAAGLEEGSMHDLVYVGPDGIIGEIIRSDRDTACVQVYENNVGLKPGHEVVVSGRPLSVLLGPGLISTIYDGIQRPLGLIAEQSGNYIRKGTKVAALDPGKKWEFRPLVSRGDSVHQGQVIGEVQETALILHRIMVPPGTGGIIDEIVPEGAYSVEDDICRIMNEKGPESLKMSVSWPVRTRRPFSQKTRAEEPLITGQRIIDTLFPIARGGTAAIPGGFGTGKTMTQHALAKWSNADLIVFIGCGERGNEMTDVLTEFPQLTDPRTGRPLMERTIMIANTSNMPVPAREVSIYTGVTIAEYFRDMGYSVAVMADSTSRWAEALRELSSRLEEMPAEEGFPTYLATRLAEFYERAGHVTTLSGKEGSITIIGSISPPGGDFSEPVTQHTMRFVRTFWALDKTLADARHYPSISWIDSYTEYIDDISEWWTDLDSAWPEIRIEAINLLLDAERLQHIVRLVGPDVLPVDEKFVLFCADLIKNGFLQQNSFDPVDMYSSPEKQIELLKVFINFYRDGMDLLSRGVSLNMLISLDSVSDMIRLKSDVPNDELQRFEDFRRNYRSDVNTLK